MSYDTECAELARKFLEDSDVLPVIHGNIAPLAQAIQDCIEDWLSYEEDKALTILEIDAGDVEPVPREDDGSGGVSCGTFSEIIRDGGGAMDSWPW